MASILTPEDGPSRCALALRARGGIFLHAEWPCSVNFRTLSQPIRHERSCRHEVLVRLKTNQSLPAPCGRAGSVERTRLIECTRRDSGVGLWRFLPPRVAVEAVG